MVTKEQLLNGILTYIDSDVIPALPTSSKWAIGSFILLATNRYNEIFNELTASPFIKTLNIVNSDGLVDVDRLAEAIRTSADKYGKLTVTIPIVGTLTFGSNDISKLLVCIKGGA